MCQTYQAKTPGISMGFRVGFKWWIVSQKYTTAE